MYSSTYIVLLIDLCNKSRASSCCGINSSSKKHTVINQLIEVLFTTWDLAIHTVEVKCAQQKTIHLKEAKMPINADQ